MSVFFFCFVVLVCSRRSFFRCIPHYHQGLITEVLSEIAERPMLSTCDVRYFGREQQVRRDQNVCESEGDRRMDLLPGLLLLDGGAPIPLRYVDTMVTLVNRIVVDCTKVMGFIRGTHKLLCRTELYCIQVCMLRHVTKIA